MVGGWLVWEWIDLFCAELFNTDIGTPQPSPRENLLKTSLDYNNFSCNDAPMLPSNRFLSIILQTWKRSLPRSLEFPRFFMILVECGVCRTCRVRSLDLDKNEIKVLIPIADYYIIGIHPPLLDTIYLPSQYTYTYSTPPKPQMQHCILNLKWL